jgi:hypothetical protein
MSAETTTDRAAHPLGDAPIDPKYRDKMEHLARHLDRFFNGAPEGASRADIVALFREQIARFESRMMPEARA